METDVQMTQPLMDADEVFGEEGQEFVALVTEAGARVLVPPQVSGEDDPRDEKLDASPVRSQYPDIANSGT